MKRIAAYVAAAALLAVQAVPLAVAQTQAVPPLNPAPQTQDGTTYVSGGIADHWQQAMEAQRGQYNLHLLFAQVGTGAYFANVPVEITDSSGRTVLSAVSQGPAASTLGSSPGAIGSRRPMPARPSPRRPMSVPAAVGPISTIAGPVTEATNRC